MDIEVDILTVFALDYVNILLATVNCFPKKIYECTFPLVGCESRFPNDG